MRRILLLMISLAPFGIINSQADLDSMWNNWNNESLSDTVRARSIYTFAWNGYLYSKSDSAFFFALMLYDFATEKQLKDEMIQALNIMGASYLVRSDFNRAMGYYQ